MTQHDKSKSQSQKFIDKARELGCDEDEKAFDDKLRKIARQKPVDEAEKDKPAN
jgi:hypothetical protein